MNKRTTLHLLLSMGTFLVFNIFLNSQNLQPNLEELIKKAPKVFIDCQSCDFEFIKSEITFVNYVRDPLKADIYVLITDLPTGNKGTEYTISFIGQNIFKGIEKTLKYYSQNTDTEDMVRKGIVNTLKIGIIPFLANSPLVNYLSVSFQSVDKLISARDKWNFWVFSLSADSSISGEKSRDDISILGSLSAYRLTQRWKIVTSAYVSYDKYNFEIDKETISSSQKLKGLNCLIVKSVNDHFSGRIFLDVLFYIFKYKI